MNIQTCHCRKRFDLLSAEIEAIFQDGEKLIPYRVTAKKPRILFYTTVLLIFD